MRYVESNRERSRAGRNHCSDNRCNESTKISNIDIASDIGCTVSQKYDQYEVLLTRSVSSDGQDLSQIPLSKSTFNYEINEGWEALKW